MRILILLTILIVPLLVSAQDLIIFRNGDSLNCKITKADSLSIYYTVRKEDRKRNSFVEKNEVRSYHLNNSIDSISNHNNPIAIKENEKSSGSNKTVVLDSTVYVKSYNKWITLLTYSQKYGIHANGWSIQGYGYILKNDSKWIIPLLYGIEYFNINQDYFSQSGYQTARINYYMVGIGPLRKLNDYFYANIGCQFLIGTESLVDLYGRESTNSVYGIAPFQGILFIPTSKFGICIGLGLYEKLLTSEFYQNDIGVKLEIGLKF